MSSGCNTDPTTPGAPPPSQPISGALQVVGMPTIDFSSMAMYPTVIGWAVLYSLAAILVVFIGGSLSGYTGLMDYWSKFVWASLFILLVVLIAINGSYDFALTHMTMCKNAQDNFVKVAMSILAIITVILCYIMYYEFGTNKSTQTYLLIMLHVNFLGSLLNLCLVTIHKLSDANRKT